MIPYVLQVFPDALGAEGYTRWMYLDKRGFVTVGQGNMLESAQEAKALPWENPDGSIADPAAVEAAWIRVKSAAAPAAGGASPEAKAISVVTLSDAATKAAIRTDIRAIAGALERWWPGLASLPADAQLAVMRWAWAMGPDPRKAPHMFAALKNRDFASALTESHWENEDPAVWAMMKTLFTNASAIDAYGQDPTVLVWPDSMEQLNVAASPSAPPVSDPTMGADEDHTFTNAEEGVTIKGAHYDGVLDTGGFDPFGLGATLASGRAAAQSAQEAAQASSRAIHDLSGRAEETLENFNQTLEGARKYGDDADTAVKVGLGLALGVVALKLLTGYLEKKAEQR